MSRGRRRDEYQQEGYSDYRSGQALNRRTADNDYHDGQYDAYNQGYSSYEPPSHAGYAPDAAYGWWGRDYDRGYDDYHTYNGGDNWNAYPQRNSRYNDYDSHHAQQDYSRNAYSSYESRYDGGYGDYIRPQMPAEESEYRYDREPYTGYRDSNIPANSRGFSSYARPPLPQRPREQSPRSRPPIPQRTSPRPEYLSLARKASSHLEDPSTVRKLLVLDLNGSLLLRSAHKRAGPPGPPAAPARWQSRGSDKRSPSPAHDPYADPTAPRGLRSVHPRPYLGAFVSYVLHESTRSWLDTMVWSSAQPHSVADMVENCFGDRKNELKAVWARDTLGLSADDYHKKSVTLKDLEKPWSELTDEQRPSSPPVTQSSRASSSPISTRTSQTASSPNTRLLNNPSSPGLSAPKTASATIHSAFTTLLVDDSLIKAGLQPWNHLVIPEYVQALRNMDMKVAEWEATLPKARTPTPEIEAGELTGNTRDASSTPPPPPGMTRIIREVVMIEGKMVSPDKTIVEDKLVPTDEQALLDKAQRRKAKRLVKKENMRAARAEKQRLAFEELETRKAEILGKPPPVFLPVSNEAVSEEADWGMHYDETLLAVVGVLDCLKHEDNVAGWLHAGGLIKTPSSDAGELPPVVSVSAGEKHAAPSRGGSPASSADVAKPTKRRRLSVSSGNGQNSEAGEEGNATLPSSSTPAQVAQATTGVPLSAPVPSRSGTAAANQESGSPKAQVSTGLWYEDKTVLKYWVARGRRALEALGIPVKSGIVPIKQPKQSKGKTSPKD